MGPLVGTTAIPRSARNEKGPAELLLGHARALELPQLVSHVFDLRTERRFGSGTQRQVVAVRLDRRVVLPRQRREPPFLTEERRQIERPSEERFAPANG